VSRATIDPGALAFDARGGLVTAVVQDVGDGRVLMVGHMDAEALEATIAKKTIRAPFDGRISIREVELGQFLGAGARIASLQSVSPIHAEFWLPQQALADLAVGQKVHVHLDTYPGATWEGEVTTVNPEVDVASRNVRVRATVENPDGRLRPGMFAKAEVLEGGPRQVLAVPATSVLYAPFGDSVYVVEPQGEGAKAGLVARQRFVRLRGRVSITLTRSPTPASCFSSCAVSFIVRLKYFR